jgi:hypothetical protein
MEGCKNLLGIPKNKKLLCILSKYRKIEAKFNKTFFLFRDRYKAFSNAYQGCAGGIKNVNLQLLDISGFEGLDKETFIEDHTCDSFKANETKDKILSKAMSDDVASDVAAKAKQGDISDRFKEQISSLSSMMNAFNKKIVEINQRFRIMENYGLHRYPGIKPAKNRIFQAILGEKGFQVINPERLAKLSVNKDFIKQFDDVIKTISEKGKDLLIPVDKSFGELIPIIHLNQTKARPEALTIISMNIA